MSFCAALGGSGRHIMAITAAANNCKVRCQSLPRWLQPLLRGMLITRLICQWGMKGMMSEESYLDPAFRDYLASRLHHITDPRQNQDHQLLAWSSLSVHRKSAKFGMVMSRNHHCTRQLPPRRCFNKRLAACLARWWRLGYLQLQ